MTNLVETLFPNLETVDLQAWRSAYKVWIESLAPNTRRAYRFAWDRFLAFTGSQPWAISSSHIIEWVQEMREAGNSKSTINQRVCAISSFYRFVSAHYLVRTESGEAPLHPYNPAGGFDRPKINRSEAVYLTTDQTALFLRSIPRHTPQGKRDFALFLFYIATGRRNSEIRNLRWSHFRTVEGGIRQFHWTGKGSAGWDECPPDVWAALEDWMKVQGRNRPHGGYVFTRLPRWDGDQPDQSQPLTAGWVNKLLRKYARRAGIQSAGLRVHSLRHTHTMILRSMNVSLSRIQERLGHSSPQTTGVYLHTLEGGRNPEWTTAREMFNL